MSPDKTKKPVPISRLHGFGARPIVAWWPFIIIIIYQRIQRAHATYMRECNKKNCLFICLDFSLLSLCCAVCASKWVWFAMFAVSEWALMILALCEHTYLYSYNYVLVLFQRLSSAALLICCRTCVRASFTAIQWKYVKRLRTQVSKHRTHKHTDHTQMLYFSFFVRPTFKKKNIKIHMCACAERTSSR